MKRSIAPVALGCASLAIPTLMASQAPSATAVEPLLRASFDVVSVNVLIAVAYGEGPALLESQVAGSPSWAATDRFEINATFDGPMLADRFKLRIHRETRQLPVYDLVVADADGRRLGPRLTRAPGTCVRLSGALPANVDFSALCGFKRVTPSMITGKGLNMDALAGALGQRPDVQRIVRDRTALEGEFDLELEYTPFTTGDPQTGPGMATAMRDQLGLALRPATGPVDVFVIDSVERPAAD